MINDFHKTVHKIGKLGQSDLFYIKWIELMQTHQHVEFEGNWARGYGEIDKIVIFKGKVIPLVMLVRIT